MTMNLPIVADSLSLYLTEIRKFPLLSPDEERLYAVKFFEEKDLESAHRLITSNLRFVVKVASEYKSYGMKMLDLIQEGNIGLIMAVRKFNPHKGIRLISYAVWWIRAYIQNYIISAWSLLKIGTTQAQKKLFFKLNQAKNAIRQLTGADNLEATALALDVKESEAVEMNQRMQGEFSLDAEVVAGEGLTLLESLIDDRQNQEEALAEQQEASLLQGQVAQAMERLNEKERYVIERRVASDEPLTLQEIADHFSISRERVRQIEENALKKIKNHLTPIIV
ncbi:RNA polymerase sigma factor RpoH [Geobacter benzoatilyticus]|uniref:RNA polymerase sigma factor n=1 Tax=Geobacter benzoatilyticus TaxID=2815309 RepID=A0ABX7Q5D1_9BACT|nr:RNA polymerase sigma factor RpoH [Geobacter benzoatilyticus]QSV46113.1 RNA polymerase sigma factor RpoH [Geobacter benzoatilyticus]